MDKIYLAQHMFEQRRYDDCIAECTALLAANGLDQAAWFLKLRALTERDLLDDTDLEPEGVAELLLDENALTGAQAARPGTSLQRPLTTAQNLRPMTGLQRPSTAFARPGTTLVVNNPFLLWQITISNSGLCCTFSMLFDAIRVRLGNDLSNVVG